MKKETVFFWIILFTKWIQQNVIDLILEFCFGYTTQFGLTKKKDFQNSARRVKVWARGAYSITSYHTLDNFLYTYISSINPEDILYYENMTLMVSFEFFIALSSVLSQNVLSRFRVWMKRMLGFVLHKKTLMCTICQSTLSSTAHNI